MKEDNAMIPVPHSIMNDYVAILTSCEIPSAQVENYKKGSLEKFVGRFQYA